MSIQIQFAQMDMPNLFWVILLCVMPIHICAFFTDYGMDVYSAGLLPAAIQAIALTALLCATPFVFRKTGWPSIVRFCFLPLGYVLTTLVTNFLPTIL